MKQCTINFSKLSSFKLMSLSDCTFLNIENDFSALHEVTGAYLSEEIWGKVSLCCFFCLFFQPFGLSLDLPLSLSLSLIHINKMHYYAS